MNYSSKISERIGNSSRQKNPENPDGTGIAAKFSCGSTVTFFLWIDARDGLILQADFATNGCGHLIAASDILREQVQGKHLAGLHGLSVEHLTETVQNELGGAVNDRIDCSLAAVESLKASFFDLRSRRVDEFIGERALICTCFGVTREQIEGEIKRKKLQTIAEVGMATNAGTGCGSCQMLIQEMLDAL